MNKDNFNNIKLPENLDMFIENTVENAVIKKRKNNKKRGIKYSATIAAGLSIVILFCISNPTIASSIPFLGDIYKYLNKDTEKIYDTYLEYSTPINLTEESNGIKVTIKEAIFDGRILNFTYEIESDRDLGDNPIIGAYSLYPVTTKEGKELKHLTENQERLEGNNYIGQFTYKVEEDTEILDVTIDWKNIVTLIEGGGFFSKTGWDDVIEVDGDIDETIKGQWTFNMKLNAVKNNIMKVNKTIESDLYDFTVEEIAISPVSFNIDYNLFVRENKMGKWKFGFLDVEIKDDLGNIYQSEEFGGVYSSNGWTGEWSSNRVFEKVNEKASKLIITPKVSASKWNREINGPESQEKTLDSIEIELE